MSIDPDKYITFKTEEFFETIDNLLKEVDPRKNQDAMLCSAEARANFLADWLSEMLSNKVRDAVVIRRQDKFAGPALHTYAAMISVATSLMNLGPATEHLRGVADYFADQASMADGESYKVPD